MHRLLGKNVTPSFRLPLVSIFQQGSNTLAPTRFVARKLRPVLNVDPKSNRYLPPPLSAPSNNPYKSSSLSKLFIITLDSRITTQAQAISPYILTVVTYS